MDTGNMADQSGLEDVMPQNSQLYVWRYMNVAALLWILQTKSIFFTRITKLQRDDPYEGAMSRSLKRLFDDKEEAIAKGIQVSAELENHSKFACVNCWHLNEEESAAIWKLYSSDLGVAIQSRVSILEGVFKGTGVKMAEVQYIDFEGYALPALPYPAYHKRKSFSHENELRLVILNHDTITHPDGVSVNVDLELLLKRVYVSPSAPSWIADVVRRELKHYGLEASVIHSELYSRALTQLRHFTDQNPLFIRGSGFFQSLCSGCWRPAPDRFHDFDGYLQRLVNLPRTLFWCTPFADS